jgi:hypothetical protein
MTSTRPAIAGIPIPDTNVTREATEFVRDVSSQLLFDHSRRVFLWASLQGERLGLDYDRELLYVGAMFHDIGLVVSAGMRDKPETAFGTMNTDILEATTPDYVRPNFCDYIQNSRFES